MSPVTMTKNPEAADYGAVPSSPGVGGETMNLIQKQADEATAMAKEAKRTSRLSASLLVGAAALFFAGYAFSSSVPNSKQMRSKLSVLGDWYNDVSYYRLGIWPREISKDEVANFCGFESFHIDAPDSASHPCARCYMIGVAAMGGDYDVTGNGMLDFAKCYYKGLTYQGREVTKADYTLKPFDEKTNTCDMTLELQNDYFRKNGYWANPHDDMFPEEDDPILTEDGFGKYTSYLLNDYLYHMFVYCAKEYDLYY